MSKYVLTSPDGEKIPYLLERRTRRTVGMRITPKGLLVRAPKRISQEQIERLLLTKINWIVSKLRFHQQNKIEPMQWQDGAKLWLLGNELTLCVKQDTKNRAVECSAGYLHVALPTPEDEEAIARKVLQWYRKQALADFGRRLELLAARLGVNTPRLFLSNASTRWGSCNSKKEIRLNWKLIQAPPHIINYVTAHELAHLKEMNHSARFWAVVESIYPEYKKAEKELKQLSPRLHAVTL
ncbi:MAG TPA: SprT family zinc-dependent metalloprotease [Methylophilaceae bacterium]|nr:SprT family zinc-dependent metalloprotease [Methylophilaceae bacterium]